MKAAYANGVLTAFEQAGHHLWDVVLGTSAGGALAAWYSAGQAEFAESTWPYANDSRIINYGRFLRRQGPLMDHESLLEVVYKHEHPLDVQAVQKAPWPVVVTAVDVDTGQAVYHDIRHGDAIEWLKATGRLPMWCGPPVIINGRRLLDGGVADPIPVHYAMDQLGCNHITLITNKPVGPKKPDPKFIVDWAVKQYPALEHGLRDHQDIKWKSVQAVLEPPAHVQGHVIAPKRPTKLTRLGRNMEAVREAIVLGRRDGQAHLRALDAF